MNLGSVLMLVTAFCLSVAGMPSGGVTSRSMLRKLLESMKNVERQITLRRTRNVGLAFMQSDVASSLVQELQKGRRTARNLPGLDKKESLAALNPDEAFSNLCQSMGVNPKTVKGTSSLRITPSIVLQHKLYCKNGYFLAMSKEGQVNGTLNSIEDDLTNLEFLSIGRQLVLIRSASTNLYIAMNKHSRIHAVVRPTLETVFLYETYKKTSFFTFKSLFYRHQNWYLALKRTGNVKPGKSTAARQSSAQFLLI